MNRELFVSMQKRLSPSPEARAALEARLAGKRRRAVPRYAVLAACWRPPPSPWGGSSGTARPGRR